MPRVIAAYEKNIEALEHQKLVLTEKLQESVRIQCSYERFFEHSMRFLSSFCQLWNSGRFDLQVLVQKLVFSDPVKYCSERGFLNTKYSMPFNVLGVGLRLELGNGAHGVN